MRIAVVIPAYKVQSQISRVIEGFLPLADKIFVVDDACQENTGQFVLENHQDPRIEVIHHHTNQGVGGAVITGYRAALAQGFDIVVKVDGDGQMAPEDFPRLISPILDGRADYTKGNRFYRLESLSTMPRWRLLGNAALSFINKLSSGYWNIMDPTNGYTAIHAKALALLPLDKLDCRYFFESDMLFRLGLERAVVSDIPMAARYGDEISSLSLMRVLREFPRKHAIRVLKRIFYNYLLRDFNAGTLEGLLGVMLLLFGLGFGGYQWFLSNETDIPASSGTVMLAALPLILGTQLLLAAISFDTQNTPRECLHKLL